MKRAISILVTMAIVIASVFSADLSAYDRSMLDTKIITVADTVSYLVVDASKYNSKIKDMFLDGRRVDYTFVDSSGRIAKKEYDGAHSSLKIILQNGRTIESDVSGVYKAFPYRISNMKAASPDVVIGHAIMAVWDYHSVAKDENGNELVYPDKTTFDVNYSKKQEAISQDSNLEEEILENPNPTEMPSSNVFDYGKNAVFEYDLKNDIQKNKFDKLKKLVKVYTNKQEANLKITKVRNGNKGLVKILYNASRPIQKNGKHIIKHYYNGIDAEINTIFYKDKSPEIVLTADSGEYVTGKSIIFNLKGFSYLFQQDTGVQAVYLNGHRLTRKRVVNPDENYSEAVKHEAVAENESENPWHVVGETLRVKNDGIKYLKKGINYITVQYDGFHDSNLKFKLNSNNVRPSLKNYRKVPSTSDTPRIRALNSRKMRLSNIVKINKASDFIAKNIFGANGVKANRFIKKVDTVSAATSGGSSVPSVGSDSSGGGSVSIGSKLAFKFDAVANAAILEKLGYDVEGAKKLLDAWEGTSKEIALMNDNTRKRVVWDRYLTYVQNNKVNNNIYKSFLDYYNDSSVELTQNGYNVVKYVFDGKFGAPIYGMKIFKNSSEENSKPIPLRNKRIDVRFRSEGYSDMLMNVNEEAKFDILTFNSPEVISVDIIKDDKYALSVDKSGYKYYKALGMLSINQGMIKEPGDYTAVFHFDGASDAIVYFTVAD
ncbi:hypothetical protein [Peptostreptococcus sp. D1]|uniref:hypothetical protein n=1 Tax=Peptostreptococcus sp. D1 TaxID=72304 RepID=UPI0008EFBC71|nr:hypothetical protein [Peptostreptococcus sp. D1]SFE55415.1 hypothetical protein SAMN02910278_01124 [Peptostreptococcus sp. D1]